MRRLAAYPMLALLAGCAAGSCDPGNAGFFGGVGCAASGGYTQRTTSLQVASAQAQSGAAVAEANASFAQQNADQAEANLDALRAQMQAMSAKQASLQRKLNIARAQGRANGVQADRLQRQVSDLNTQLQTLQSQPSPDAAKVQRIQQEQQTTLSELTSLSAP